MYREGYRVLLTLLQFFATKFLFLHRGGGDFLRRYREAKGWNRQQLADHAKVSRTSIRCWESGQKTISQKCFCHLVENLGSDFPSMLRM
jgi:predicted transcriptional regulator